MAISSFKRSGLARVTSPSAADFSGTPTGTYTDNGVNYKYLTFTGNGTLTVTKAGFADVLIVGGGGPGGNSTDGNRAGGGGGGGLLYLTDLYVAAGSITVTVGAGGAAGTPGSRGDASIFNGIYSPGGGRGAPASANNRSGDGASGGGGRFSTVGGLGIPGLGNDGGQASLSVGGGGGGAGGAGATGASGGAGGAGAANSITGSAVTYAAGGPGTGGNTGGAANTGDGGQGAINTNPGGSGGSGVVIVRVRTN
jgi:hypothetical protein